MSDGLSKTFQVLRASQNRTVGEVLSFAFEGDDPDCRLLALQAILRSKNVKAGMQVVDRWNALPAAFQKEVIDHPLNLTGSLRQALSGRINQRFENALEMVAQISDPQLIPECVRIAELTTEPYRERASLAISRIVEVVLGKVESHALGAGILGAKSTLAVRRAQVLECLEKSMNRFSEHQNPIIVEAFLCLAEPKNRLLMRVLRNPRDPAASAVVNALMESLLPEIYDGILTDYLDQTDVPPFVVKVWNTRTDIGFIRAFCDKIGTMPSDTVRANLKRLKNVRWLSGNLTHLLNLDRDQQTAVTLIAKYGSLDSSDVYRVVESFLEHGGLETQRNVAERLGDIRNRAADRLIEKYVDHPDPRVQALMLSQLKPRMLPSASNKLIAALDSPHEMVREVAMSNLPEIQIEKFLTAFDTMDSETRKTTAELVKKVDSTTCDRLESELSSPARSRRLRGLQVVEVMNCIEELEQQIVELLGDEDHHVRAATADLLGRGRSRAARQALRDAMLDSSVMVRIAAERSLQMMAEIPDPA